MPAPQLFVDSDEENEGFDDVSENDYDDDDQNNVGNGTVNNGTNGDDEGQKKGKKRKGLVSRNEARRAKKLKKLGPKQAKGGKKGDTLTKEEIKELTEKEYTVFSNLYDVQLEELLKETEVAKGTRDNVLEWVDEFRKFIQKQKKSKSIKVAQYPTLVKEVQLPIQRKIFFEEAGVWMLNWMREQMITWQPPDSVHVKGSWALGTELDKVSAVDVFMEMPGDYLLKSDYMNHKYHVKRAIYLGVVAKMLMDRGDSMVEFSMANGDPLKPVIKVDVNGVSVMIRAVMPQNYFKLSKLACDRNNLRFEHFFEKPKPEDEPDTSTQHYNFTILEDSLATEMNNEIESFLSCRPKFKEAVKLIKIWLTQRGVSQGYGGFSGFAVANFMNYLSRMNRISENMSSLQILRTFFVNIIQEDLTEKGIGFCDQIDSIKFAQLQWDLVFLDSTGLLNFFANMSRLTWRRIQEEAKQALTIIDKRNVTGFLALFTTKVKFLMNFDHVIRLAPRRLEKSFLAKPEHIVSLLDHSGFVYPVTVSAVGSLIERCLGKRITMLDCQLLQSPTWSVTEVAPHNFPVFIHFGVNINRELSQKLIEKCETEDHAKIQEFKTFWGDKSELRRFKDGTLQECVALENISHLGKNRLCYQMLHYILQQHLGYTMGENMYIDRQVESLVETRFLKVKPVVLAERLVAKGKKLKMKGKKIYLKGKLSKKKMKKMAIAAADEKEFVSVDDVTKVVSSSFDELSKILRQLEKLPLQISTVQGTSAVLRFSHVHPTPPQTYFINKEITCKEPNRNTLMIKSAESNSNAKTKNVVKNGDSTADHEDCPEDNDDDDDVQIIKEVASSSSSVGQVPPKLPKYVEPVGVIIHLETSGQWPDNMQAIDRLKCAFLIKIGELLKAKFGLTVQPYSRHLDVLKDGLVFRIKITYFRELTLLRELRGTDGVLRKRDNQESLRLEREALILPQLTSTLHSFHLQYEAFGKTCRLAKRWVASQLLLASPWEYNQNLDEQDCRITEECVELLVAYLFLNYAPHLSYPCEAQVGFQRFLYLLAKTDFHAVPIIINFHDKWTADEVSAIELEFVKTRPTLPSLFISTPFDQKGSVWTRNLLSVVLRRVKLIADVALSVMEGQLDSQRVIKNFSGLGVLFSPLTRDLDVLIRLKSKMNPRSPQSVEKMGNPVVFKAYTKDADEVIPVTDFDPVQMYLQELRDSFGHLAVFLHDTYGGDLIGVKWRPDVFKPTTFTTTTVKGRCANSGTKNSISANVNGILEALGVMGDGLVESIETFPEKWETV